MSKTTFVIGVVAGGFIMHWGLTGDLVALWIGLVIAALGGVLAIKQGKETR